MVFLVNLLAFLFSQWSVDCKVFIGAKKVNDVTSAEFVKVVPRPHKGFKTICPLVRTSHSQAGAKADPEAEDILFFFQKKRYEYKRDKKTFEKIRFPVNKTFEYYQRSRGIPQQQLVDHLSSTYGPNRFDIPLQTFWELYKEHALAPFFVFQMFCLLLWMLDEYWYYSFFTAMMLLLFESTVVKSRLRNMSELRRMQSSAFTVHVLRCGKWCKLQSDQLLPGDMCSLTRSPPNAVTPCDVLLLSGTLVADESLLTGESVPQWKESIARRSGSDEFSFRSDKVHVAFSGTRILQHSLEKDNPDPAYKTPDGGCAAFVLRTGFNTSQGKLMRTILFSQAPITVNSFESIAFILVLLVFALCAAGYVLNEGLKDPDRSRYKLFLNCTLIVTSVVPPELPMELSLAVQNSLLALARLGIFCTEPFRIPYAGKVDVCCFDKTGTLTSDEFIVRGLVTIPEPADKAKHAQNGNASSTPTGVLVNPAQAPEESALVVAGCHSLVFLDNELVGDPMEKAALHAMQWTYNKGEVAMPKKGGRQQVRIVQRFHFSSSLKRMVTIAQIDTSTQADTLWSLAKGAPETIETLLTNVPERYDATHKSFSRKGYRVLALACKQLESMPMQQARALAREQVEKGLTFAGFLVFDCPLKKDSQEAIDMLINSSHRVLMITGDHVLTACQVAADLRIVTRPVLILTATEGKIVKWVSPDETINLPLGDDTPSLSLQYDLCISGAALACLAELPPELTVPFNSLIPYGSVFARVSPEHKEMVITTLKSLGAVSLMCGDGTNDVGALKHAHIGVALIGHTAGSPKPAASSAKGPAGQLTKTKARGSGDSSAAAPPAAPAAPPQRPTSIFEAYKLAMAQAQAQAQARREGRPVPPMGPPQMLSALEVDEDGVPIVRFGDASIASSFTSKQANVLSTCHIIRQGRCTLVTTLQMFEILALNCLISAYSLSVLYLDGVKFGDRQMTFTGLGVALFFLFISRSKPLPTLSAQRPPSRVFSPSVVLSIIGQFAIHLACIIISVKEAKRTNPEEMMKRPEPDSDFSPNLVNSVVFLVSSAMQTATFAVNYKGHPFMEGMMENKPLLYCVAVSGVSTVLCASGLAPWFNSWFELVPFPSSQFRNELVLLLLGDVFGTLLWDRGINWLANLGGTTLWIDRCRASFRPPRRRS